MTTVGWLQILAFAGAIFALTPPAGAFLYRVLEGHPHPLQRPLGWLERLLDRAGRVDGTEQTWPEYTRCLLLFSGAALLITYAMLRLQAFLPLDPAGLGPVPAALAFNTAVSFATNTNWQSYAGESTMSVLSQMAALAWQNFVSAAAGIAVAAAVARGLTRAGDGRTSGTIGNFWTDLVRSTVYILLPAATVVALVFVSQGLVQTLAAAREVTTLEGGRQIVALGPVASQEAIKQLGTNGGGFFNANSAHPFENPTPGSNFLAMLLVFLIPAGLTSMFGRMAGNRRQGWVLFGAMMVLFLAGAGTAYWAEAGGSPFAHVAGMAAGPGNMEGKEVRFGVPASALFATLTTDASCGAVNAMHDSFTPLGGLVPLFNIQLGEVVFGGVGAGLYGMLVMAVLSVFITGLMVGRTPEYLGKKIETREMQLAMLYVLVFPVTVLALAAASAVRPSATAALGNAGPHGFSEILYAFTSAAGNNGSAFAGLSADTPWYNATLGAAMLIGRFWMIIPALAIAGSLSGKKPVPQGSGSLPTDGGLFMAVLIGVIVIVGALTFFPALSLGPLVEHFLAGAGKVF